MTVRTNDDAVNRRLFKGVVEAGVSLDDQVDEIHGAFDPRGGSLTRIPGKLLSGTGTTTSIWSIHQLRFRDSNALIEKFDSHILAQTDLPPLPGYEFDLPKPPVVLAADYGESNTGAQDAAAQTSDSEGMLAGAGNPWFNGARADRGYNASGPALLYLITATPDVAFTSPPDRSEITRVTVEVTSSSHLTGNTLFKIRATWTSSWLVVVTGDHNTVPASWQLASWDFFAGQLWLGVHMPLEIGFDSTSLDGTSYADTITFTVTDQWGNPIYNSNGDLVTAHVHVTLTQGELAITATPNPFSMTTYEGS